MKFFPHREFYAYLGLVFWITLSATTSFAQQYRIQTQTHAEATQFIRSDRSIAAQRPFSQSLSLWGYNLLGPKNDPVQLHFQVRYFHDFADPDHYQDPYLTARFNRASIDQAWIQWSPFSKLQLRGGRFILRSLFPAKDIDGATFSLRLGNRTKWKTLLYGGRHVIGRPQTWNSDQYDIQGRPIELRTEHSPSEWIYGARSSLGFKTGSYTLAYEKRLFGSIFNSSKNTVSDERIGVTATGNPTSRTVVTGFMSYHTLSKTLHRGHFSWTWRPTAHVYTSSGFEHIIPIFDASSIFNLFGANPSQSIYSTFWLGNNKRHLQTRAWIKFINGDPNALDIASKSEDVRNYGFALQYSERIKIWGRPLHIDPSLSFQPADARSYVRNQLIGRVLFRYSILGSRWVAGSTFLWVGGGNAPNTHAHFALTHRFGIDIPASFGVFSLASVFQDSDILGKHLNLFASFKTELWL